MSVGTCAAPHGGEVGLCHGPPWRVRTIAPTPSNASLPRPLPGRHFEAVRCAPPLRRLLTARLRPPLLRFDRVGDTTPHPRPKHRAASRRRLQSLRRPQPGTRGTSGGQNTMGGHDTPLQWIAKQVHVLLFRYGAVGQGVRKFGCAACRRAASLPGSPPAH